jgi:3-hydroxybutyryl-CoA dehydrogenase
MRMSNPNKMQTICVCGAGTMGAGIAQSAAQHGFEVILHDVFPASLQKARTQINGSLDTLVQKQKISSADQAAILQRIRFTGDPQQCLADLCIEAIVEDADKKTELLEGLAAINGDHAIYASNTSSLSITSLAKRFRYPERLAGLHFFNPPAIMKLVELIHGRDTDPQVLQALHDFALAIGKVPVHCKDAPGFIVNRVARPYYIEALRLAEEGVPLATIDALMESAGFKMGPFRLMDLIGQDINYAVSCSVYEQLGQPARLQPSYLQAQKVAEGKLGRKTGAGFYTYNT